MVDAEDQVTGDQGEHGGDYMAATFVDNKFYKFGREKRGRN